MLPRPVRRALVRATRWPPVGTLRFGSLRRLQPVSREWGFDRGLPVDRYYIEQFLREHASDITGRVLEVRENLYTTRFGGNRVSHVDILHADDGNPAATIVADLTNAPHIPDALFDCIVLTQTLQFIYDVDSAVATLHRILKPGGVLLMAVSGISKISREDMDQWGHHWSFTSRGSQRLIESYFPPNGVTVRAHGNVLAALAALHGLACEELRREELDCVDPDFEVLVTVRAVKTPGP
jgi:SAM-dependent methyltransferase